MTLDEKKEQLKNIISFIETIDEEIAEIINNGNGDENSKRLLMNLNFQKNDLLRQKTQLEKEIEILNLGDDLTSEQQLEQLKKKRTITGAMSIAVEQRIHFMEMKQDTLKKREENLEKASFNNPADKDREFTRIKNEKQSISQRKKRLESEYQELEEQKRVLTEAIERLEKEISAITSAGAAIDTATETREGEVKKSSAKDFCDRIITAITKRDGESSDKEGAISKLRGIITSAYESIKKPFEKQSEGENKLRTILKRVGTFRNIPQFMGRNIAVLARNGCPATVNAEDVKRTLSLPKLSPQGVAEKYKSLKLKSLTQIANISGKLVDFADKHISAEGRDDEFDI